MPPKMLMAPGRPGLSLSQAGRQSLYVTELPSPGPAESDRALSIRPADSESSARRGARLHGDSARSRDSESVTVAGDRDSDSESDICQKNPAGAALRA